MQALTFICLAKSWKSGGMCLAGKALVRNEIRSWVRPVSRHDEGGVSKLECCYANYAEPRLREIVTCGFERPCPDGMQTENFYISDRTWSRNGFYGKSLFACLDQPDSLWAVGHSSRHGCNDAMPADLAQQYRQSLYLVFLESAVIHVAEEGSSAEPRPVARISFTYKDCDYKLKITDIDVSGAFLQKPAGEYPLRDCFMTVSCSRPFHGKCYKLAAGLIF